MIENILKWNDNDVKSKLCCKTFFEHKLKGMLTMLFKDSFFAAIDNAYPGKYKEWDFFHTPRNFWNRENARKATYWLFKEHLGFTDDKIKENITRRIFVENGLDTMMHIVYKNNATEAIKDAFGDIF